MLRAIEKSFRGTPRFELHRRIGEGAVGVVYEAFDREHGSWVALKTLRMLSPEGLLSLKSEFRAVQNLRHPNLVRLGELLEADGVWFFTMELLRGLPLTEWLRSRLEVGRKSSLDDTQRAFRCDEQRVRRAFGQLVNGLAALHTAGRVHRDVKPSNVLVTEEGRVVILDFGVTRDMLSVREDESIIGTAAYMAPEQALLEAVGPAADWYAAGVVLYQALTGSLPFTGSLEQILEQKLLGTPPDPRALVPELSSELAELCQGLLHAEPQARPSGAELAQRLGVSDARVSLVAPAQSSAAIVGRTRELNVLSAAFADTEKGHGAAVVVSGESGVGKSYLIGKFLDLMGEHRTDLTVLAGRCYERESVPYKAFDGVIDQLTVVLGHMPEDELLDVLPPHFELLMRAFPVLEAVPHRARKKEPETRVLNPQELRARVFSSVRALFHALASLRRLVIAIDDLQWADADSLALLHEVMRTPDEPPLLLLATERVGTDARRAGKETTPIPGNVRRLQLETLPFEAAAELTRALLRDAGDETLSSEQVQRIVEDAKGHPLFIDELVRQRAAHADGSVMRLDDALFQRVSALPPAARRTLELLAVAGTPVSQETAAKAAALDFAQLFDIATELRAGALVRMHGAARDSLIEPYHDRIRESVLGHLPADVRATWHLRLATTLEEAPTSDPETVANHWLGAGHRARAAEYYVRAAEQSSAVMAFERAARLYGKALEYGAYDDARRVQLEQELALALANSGQLAAAAEVRIALASAARDHEQLDQQRQAAELLMCSGHFEKGLGLLRGTLEQVGVYQPSSRFWLVLGLLFWRAVLIVRGLALPRQPRASRDVLMRVDTTGSAGHAYSMSDNIRGAYFQTRCLYEALSAGEPERVVRALAMAICSHSAGGMRVAKRTQKMVATEEALAAQVGTPVALGSARGAAGFAAFNTGRFREAKEELNRAESLFRDECVGQTFYLNTVRGILFRTLFALGDLRELRARSAPVLREAQHQNDRYMIIVCQSAAGALLGAQADRLDQADEALHDARSRLVEGEIHLQHYWTYTAECQISLYRGDAVSAYERMNFLAPAMQRALLWKIVPCRMLVTALRGRAATALSLARPAEAEALLRGAERDVRWLGGTLEPWGRPAASALRGTIALARGRESDALRHLADAARGYERANMRLYAAAARRLEGLVRGGDEGAALVRMADDTFAMEGVVDPARMTALLVGEAPGARS